MTRLSESEEHAGTTNTHDSGADGSTATVRGVCPPSEFQDARQGGSGRMNAGMFSSDTPEWATPWPLFRGLEEEFGPFDVDVCARPENAKVARFFSPEDDGLAQTWGGRCWMNPPYGRPIGAWVKKAREAGAAGARVVCLLPARTDTAWWHDNVIPYARVVRFLRGRVRFSDAGPAPFPSAVVVFGD